MCNGHWILICQEYHSDMSKGIIHAKLNMLKYSTFRVMHAPKRFHMVSATCAR